MGCRRCADGLRSACLVAQRAQPRRADRHRREPRQLTNLAKVPIAVVSGEASVFRFTNGPLVEFLQQAGCDAVHIDLAERGVHGNSHGSMFERNNAEVLGVVTDWMDDQLG